MNLCYLYRRKIKLKNIFLCFNFRYNSLFEPCHIRRENLEEARRMYQFFRDVEDELSWIQDRQPLAESQDLGTSLSAVQNLMKKHQVRKLAK